ncbi:MAG: YceI family protein [Ferrovum sp.]|nr:YceI family protein [Ferrovum sp.]
MKLILSIILAASLMVSCTTPPRQAVALPAMVQQAPAPKSTAALRVDPHRSLVTLQVFRGGPLARLGHDHIIASHDVAGFVDMKSGYAELTVPLDRLTVDEPTLRAEAGWDTEVDAEAVAGTLRNMQVRVLQVDRFPVAQIRITRPDPAVPMLEAAITLHGVKHIESVPAVIAASSDREVRVMGHMTLYQSDFGIIPLSVMGGALQVQDGVVVDFSITASLL